MPEVTRVPRATKKPSQALARRGVRRSVRLVEPTGFARSVCVNQGRISKSLLGCVQSVQQASHRMHESDWRVVGLVDQVRFR